MENHYDFSRSIHYFSLHVSGSQTLNVDQAGYINPIQFHSTTNHKPSSKITIFLWFSYGFHHFPMVKPAFTIHSPAFFWGIPRCLAGGATSQRRSTESRDRRHRARAASATGAGRRAAAVWPVRAAGPGSPNGGGEKLVILWWFYGDFYWDFI